MLCFGTALMRCKHTPFFSLMWIPQIYHIIVWWYKGQVWFQSTLGLWAGDEAAAPRRRPMARVRPAAFLVDLASSSLVFFSFARTWGLKRSIILKALQNMDKYFWLLVLAATGKTVYDYFLNYGNITSSVFGRSLTTQTLPTTWTSS